MKRRRRKGNNKNENRTDKQEQEHQLINLYLFVTFETTIYLIRFVYHSAAIGEVVYCQ